MSSIAFADVVHQTIYFSREVKSEALALDLMETKWFQRLRDISQTGNTSLVYMFMEHSRFGHCVGVAYLANHLMNRLAQADSAEVEEYRCAVSAAAVLHDIGHIAPGSHSAYRTWYPGCEDCHEQLAIRVIKEDPQIASVLNSYGEGLIEQVAQILSEQRDLPPWTWEIISGGGWNVDRGNWCIVDSVMAGVTYGRYNIPALLESMVITPDKHLALKENRRDAMMHFGIARHSMYRQVYQHRVFLASETLNRSIVQRARDLGKNLCFADTHARAVLDSDSPGDLALHNLFAMRESWWRYHLSRWAEDPDSILHDLARRLLSRDLLKTVRIQPQDDARSLREAAKKAVTQAGFDPLYYLHEVSPSNMHACEAENSMMVLMENGDLFPLGRAEPLWNAMVEESKNPRHAWLVMPAEAKRLLGRER